MPKNPEVNPNVFWSQVNAVNGESWSVSWSHSVASNPAGITRPTEVPVDPRESSQPAVGTEHMTLNLEMAKVHEIMADIECRTLIVRVMLLSLVAIPVLFLLHPVLCLLGGTAIVRLMRDLIKYYFAKQPIADLTERTQAQVRRN